MKEQKNIDHIEKNRKMAETINNYSQYKWPKYCKQKAETRRMHKKIMIQLYIV